MAVSIEEKLKRIRNTLGSGECLLTEFKEKLQDEAFIEEVVAKIAVDTDFFEQHVYNYDSPVELNVWLYEQYPEIVNKETGEITIPLNDESSQKTEEPTD